MLRFFKLDDKGFLTEVYVDTYSHIHFQKACTMLRFFKLDDNRFSD